MLRDFGAVQSYRPDKTNAIRGHWTALDSALLKFIAPARLASIYKLGNAAL